MIPHSHEHEDEFTFVYRGRISGLVGEEEPQIVHEIAQRYGQRPHPDLIRGPVERHHIHL